MLKKNGFTILELAIVLLVVAILLGGIMMGLSGQIEQRRISETQKGLDDIKEALIGYAASQPTVHLPCPDKTTAGGVGTANDGLEDVTAAGTCVTQEGNIPWATLGVSDVDGWSHRYHYRVSPAYSNHAAASPFTLTSPGIISVCPTAPVLPAVACAATAIATNLPAVILSYGKNGRGAITNTGVLIAAPGPAPLPPANNVDEYQNTKQSDVFVSRPPSVLGSTQGEFDDQISWITSSLLNSRMISAQRLP